MVTLPGEGGTGGRHHRTQRSTLFRKTFAHNLKVTNSVLNKKAEGLERAKTKRP